MRRQTLLATAVLLAVTASAVACGGGRQTVVIPPRVDLGSFERLGLVQFTVENARGDLNGYATQRFAQHLLSSQWGYELLELGPLAEENGTSGSANLERARELAEEHGLGAVFVGHMVVSDVRPRASFRGGPRLAADVSVHLTVRMLSGPSGGTLWTRSARIRDTVAAASMAGGVIEFGAQDPDEVYGALVNRLLVSVTRDFRPTTQRR